MIVLIGGEKGGTGKTSIAVNLAVFFAMSGKDIMLVDTDRQGSSSFWAETRKGAGALFKVPCVHAHGKGLGQSILDMSERYEILVIDAGGRDSIELRYSLGVSDMVVIPIQSTQFDLATLGRMSNLVEQAQSINPKLKAFVILNRCSPNPSVTDAQEAADVINSIPNLKLFKTILKERVSYQRSVREGLSVLETNPQDHKAVAELNLPKSFGVSAPAFRHGFLLTS